MKRWLAFFALIVGLVWLGLAIQSRRRTLSADESRLVGTWNLTTATSPTQNLMTFAPDRRLIVPGVKGLNSRWSVSNRRLTIDQICKAVLFPRIPNMLPMTHTESFYWQIEAPADPNRIKLKSDDGLINCELVRSDN